MYLFLTKNRLNYFCTLALIALGWQNTLFSQELDKLKEQQPITIGGYVSTSQVFNQIPTDSSNTINYSSFYTGSLNFNFYGINTPFTFIYTNQKGNFTHPFNQYGLHPSYKWVRAHIGYASMSFSPYTMNGFLFLGVGVEVDPPGLFRASAFYGKLRKAVAYDSLNLQQIPAYQRMGYGIKLGIEKDDGYIDISFFRAYDMVKPSDTIPESCQIMPEENVAMSLSFSKTLFKNLVFSGEFASTLLTTDTRTEKTSQSKSLTKPLGWFMNEKTATIGRNAFKGNIAYNQTRFSLGAGYERVEPEYRTLGAYYFNNNFENMALNFTVNFFKNKLSLGGNTGLQRDNLDKSKMNNNVRFAGSGNMSVQASEKVNINASYSNFSSYTNVRSSFDYINQTTPYENWDTLNYRQVSQSINTSMSYQLGTNEKRSQSLSMDFTWQSSNDQQGDSISNSSDFYNASSSYVLTLIPYDFSLSASCSYNYNQSPGAKNYTWGPNLNLSKQFLKKQMNANMGLGYNTSTSNHINSGSTWNLRFGLGYNIKKAHNFNLNYIYQLRNSKGENAETHKYIVQTLTFAYVYNFQIIKQKEVKEEKEEMEHE